MEDYCFMMTEDQMLTIMFVSYAFMAGYMMCFIIEHWNQIKYVREEYKKDPVGTKRKYGRK